MNVAPGVSVVSVQVPRGVDWKRPPSPVAVHAMEVCRSLGAPKSEETTATWMFGSPFGRFSSTVMNPGSWASIFICSWVIDDELSTMIRMSRFPGSLETAPLRDCVCSPPSGTQATSGTTKRETKRACDKRVICASHQSVRPRATIHRNRPGNCRDGHEWFIRTCVRGGPAGRGEPPTLSEGLRERERSPHIPICGVVPVWSPEFAFRASHRQRTRLPSDHAKRDLGHQLCVPWHLRQG